MNQQSNKDIGILDLELYHLKHTNVDDTTAPDDTIIESFIKAIQTQLFQYIIKDRKKIIIFKGIDPFVKYINKQDKSVINAFAKNENLESIKKNSLLKINFGNSKLSLEMEREPQYVYKKNLFISLLESFVDLENMKTELRYLDESDLLSDEKCSIFNNKIWNQHELNFETKTINEEISLRIFYLLKEFMKPYMKDEKINNEGFTQILNFNNSNDEENHRGYNLTLPAFSDDIQQNSLIKSFHCVKINELTTKLQCNDTISNNAFLHHLRSKSSSVPYLYPDVIPQDNHFICFIDINDINFDNSITQIYSQVGYHDISVTESSESVVKYDLCYNLRMWDKFNTFDKIEDVFNYYVEGLGIHRFILNDFIIKKVEQFITEMDSWILLKFLNAKLKQNTNIKIKLKDGFKFLSSKILAALDMNNTFYTFGNETTNDITITIKEKSHSTYGNPREKIVLFKKHIAPILEQDVYFLFNLVHRILSEIDYTGKSNNSITEKINPNSSLSNNLEKIKLESPQKQKNKINKPISPKKKEADLIKLNGIKKNIFKLDILPKSDLLKIAKDNELKRELQKPTQEQIDKIFNLKLREIIKVFKNYDIGSGVGINVILSHDRLYGILNDSNSKLSGLDLDEFENLLNKLVTENKLLKFEISKEHFYRLK